MTIVAVALAASSVAGCQNDANDANGANNANNANEASAVVRDAHPELRDDDGLIARHTWLLPASDDEVLPHIDRPVDHHVVVLAGLEGIDARVVWTGLPCQLAPSVEVTHEQDRAVVTVDRGPEVLGTADACPSSEDFLAVDLVLSDGARTERVEAYIR